MANEVITIKINSVISPKVKRSLGSLGRTIKSVDAMAKGLNDRIKAIGSSGIAKLAKTEEVRAAKAKKAEEVLAQLKNKGADEEFARTTKQGSLEEKIASEAKVREAKTASLKEKNDNAKAARIKKEGNLAEAENNKRVLEAKKIQAANNSENRKNFSFATKEFNKERAAAAKDKLEIEKHTQAQKRGAEADRKRAIALKKTQEALKRSAVTFKKATAAAAGLTRTLRTLLVFYAANQVRELSDAYTNMENRLKLVTTSAKNLLLVQERLFAIATEARTPIADVTTAYQRFDLALRDLGASQQESLRFTETLSKQLTLSGLSTMEASQGLRQLSQALNKGKLDGDEFRTVMETIPTVSQAIAKEMGVARGELLKLAPQGKITADVIRRAVASIAIETDERFGKLVPTIGQAFTVLGVEFTKFLGEFNKSTGLFTAFSQSVIFASNNIATLTRVATAAAVVLFSPFAVSRIGAARTAMLTYAASVGGVGKAFLLLAKKGLIIGAAVAAAELSSRLFDATGELDSVKDSAVRAEDTFKSLNGTLSGNAAAFGQALFSFQNWSDAFDIGINKAKNNLSVYAKYAEAFREAASTNKTMAEALQDINEVEERNAKIRAKATKDKDKELKQTRKATLENKKLNKTLDIANGSITKKVAKYKELQKALKLGVIGTRKFRIETEKLVGGAVSGQIKDFEDLAGGIKLIGDELKDSDVDVRFEKLFKNLEKAQELRRIKFEAKQGSALTAGQREAFGKIEVAQTLKLEDKKFEAILVAVEKRKELRRKEINERLKEKATEEDKILKAESDASENRLNVARDFANKSSAISEELANRRIEAETSKDRELQLEIFILEKQVAISTVTAKILENNKEIAVLKNGGQKADDISINKLKEQNKILERRKLIIGAKPAPERKGPTPLGSALDLALSPNDRIDKIADAEALAAEERFDNAADRILEANESELDGFASQTEALVSLEQQRVDAIDKIRDEADNKKKKGEEKSNSITLSSTRALTSGLSSLFAQFNKDGEKENKAAFLAQQSFALASAGISAAAGIVQAYDNPTANEFTKFANAAAIAVAAGIQIGNIAKATFADGGHVSGRGTGTSDSIDAKLSNGEFVINSASTKANRMALEAINNSGGKTINPNPVVVQNSDQSNNLQGSFTNGLDTTSGTNSNVTVNVFPSAGVEATIETTEDENGKNIEIFVKRVDEVLAGNLKNNVGPLAASINQRINRKF